MINQLKKLSEKIKNWLTNKCNKKTVSFIKENDLWYFDYPNYPLSKHNLLMINGSDDLLELLSGGKNNITLDIYFSNELSEDYIIGDTILLERTHGNEFSGYYYNVISNIPLVKEAYFCPVMFFKYGFYPKYIIIDTSSIINKN